MGTVLLAAVTCEDLRAALAVARTGAPALFGTMDGAKLAQLQKTAPAGAVVPVHLYTPT
ncbi:MAG: hypothetical protein AB1776_06690 [Bacillota bacterium]|jgi:hypothetical protein